MMNYVKHIFDEQGKQLKELNESINTCFDRHNAFLQKQDNELQEAIDNLNKHSSGLSKTFKESFIKKLSMREEEARKALIQYLKEHPDYFNHFKEKTKKAPNDIETFVDELELDMIDFWYPQEEEADVDMYFAPYYEDDAETEEVLSVQFALSGEILSIDWDS